MCCLQRMIVPQSCNLHPPTACVVGAITLLSLACYCRGRKSSSHHTRRRMDPHTFISGTAYRPMQLDSLRWVVKGVKMEVTITR